MDVIVECAVLVAVLAQQTESINICKVFKLNQTIHSIPVNTRAALNLAEPTAGKDRNKEIKQTMKLIDMLMVTSHLIVFYTHRAAPCAFKDFISVLMRALCLYTTQHKVRNKEGDAD